MREIVVIAHNIRSAHNIGSLLRTCEGLGISRLYLTGYSPYPPIDEDERLPHIVKRIEKQIIKTSLGAEKSLPWEHQKDATQLIADLKVNGFTVVALEQAEKSIKLPEFRPSSKVALLLGSEVTGVDKELLEQTDDIVEIPMFGKKESFNVVQATAMAIYQLTFYI